MACKLSGHDKDYFGSIIGKKRPLNAIEISHLYTLMDTKLLIETLNVGYSQVVNSEKIKKFLLKSIATAQKHLDVLGGLLSDENLTVPKRTKIMVSETKESSISDRLILTHSTAVIGYILTEYGIADTNSARSDLVATFRNLVTDVLFLAKDGAELMVENGWKKFLMLQTVMPWYTDRIIHNPIRNAYPKLDSAVQFGIGINYNLHHSTIIRQ